MPDNPTQQENRRVGILGGMGPAATADFYAKLIAHTDAKRDQDHLPVVIWADPRVPDRTAALLDGGTDPTPFLRTGIDYLHHAGCEILAVPCNTAHAFLDAALDGIDLELISIIDAAADAVVDQGHRCAGLLGTTGTMAAGLHARALEARGIGHVQPDDEPQQLVMSAIAAVKAGTVGPQHRTALTHVVESLAAAGAESVIAGCTELVLAFDQPSLPVPVIDPAVELARRVAQRASRPTPTAAS